MTATQAAVGDQVAEDPRPRAKRRPYRKQQILDAAIGLFAEQGYHATGMNDIGAAVGITGPGIYRHFASKEAILEAALEQAADRTLAQVQAIAEGTPDSKDRLEQLVAHGITSLLENKALFTTALNERRNLSEAGHALFARSQRLRIQEWAQPLTKLRPDLTEAEARFLVTITQAMLISSARFHDEMPEERLREFLFNTAMAALLSGS